ncbi:MAG: 5-deoxy-glucuronate isomerase [Phycisphaerae bacterium]
MSDLSHPSNWKYSSPKEPGLHEVISPDNSTCKVTWIYRLNLQAGESFTWRNEQLEINAVVIQGSCQVESGQETSKLARLDSFYCPGGLEVKISADTESVLFIGAGPFEGVGAFFVRPLDLDMPLGEIHQIHGRPPYEREVFMTINQEVPASRLICGLTWGRDGQWTSWPPHQHSKDLEEVYCYFDIPAPRFALHAGYTQPGRPEVIHPVSTGDMVIVPEGYHPTCGTPGVRSCYFWVMVAHSAESRRYDLAVDDPNFA